MGGVDDAPDDGSGKAEVRIPWGKRFGTRFVLKKTEGGARLRATRESASFGLYVLLYLALFSIVFFVWISVAPGGGAVAVLYLGGTLPLLFMVQKFVWSASPNRSSFPRICRMVEIQAQADDAASGDPYRGDTSALALKTVIVDGRAFAHDRVEGVRLLKWEERWTDKYGHHSRPWAALVLVFRDEAGRVLPYELDVVGYEAGHERKVLAHLLGRAPMRSIRLPTDQGLQEDAAHWGPYGVIAMFGSLGIVLLANSHEISLRGERLVCVAAWLILQSWSIWAALRAEVARREAIAAQLRAL